MSIENLKSALPEYAKDLRLNLGSLAAEPSLSEEQRAGTFVASAVASHSTVTAAIIQEFRPDLSLAALSAAQAAAAIMTMNNVYYRFTHLVGGDYPTMPAKLRMNVMAKPGVGQATFELWSLAVSAIKNVCGDAGCPASCYPAGGLTIAERLVFCCRPMDVSR